jgi:hypothetical protein
MWPYTTNPIRDTWGRTRNWDDSLNIFNESHGPEGDYNPIFKAEKLGAIIDQGLVAFITMVRFFLKLSHFVVSDWYIFVSIQGVNKSASYDNFWKG